VWLVRHGPTEWSEVGKHTGRTDLALTDDGCEVARRLQSVLREAPERALCSPLQRAVRTAELGGLRDWELDDDLVEWDYGAAEGITTAEMRESIPGWTVWTHPIEGGESLDEVGARADRVVERLRALDEDVTVVAHGHFLRVLAARWCGLPPIFGRHLALSTASISILGWKREDPLLERWNVPVGGIGG
jgi:broad specificity phosphatase PhoE